MLSVLGGLLVKNHLHLGMKSLASQIGDRIRSLRRSKIPELTTEDLAELSGLSRQTIYAIEHGKNPNVAMVNINKIAKALGIPISKLLYDISMLPEMAAESSTEYRTKKREEPISDDLEKKMDDVIELMPALEKKLRPRRRKKTVA